MYGIIEQGDEGIIFDPTWQQFLPETLKGSHLPRTLIGHRDEVMATAVSAGIEPQYAPVWGSREFYDLAN